MKLFYQLSPDEQEKAVVYSMKLIVVAILQKTFVSSTGEEDIEYLCEEVIAHGTLGKTSEDILFELKDSEHFELLTDLANEFCYKTYFHEDNDNVIFISSFSDESPITKKERNDTDRNNLN